MERMYPFVTEFEKWKKKQYPFVAHEQIKRPGAVYPFKVVVNEIYDAVLVPCDSGQIMAVTIQAVDVTPVFVEQETVIEVAWHKESETSFLNALETAEIQSDAGRSNGLISAYSDEAITMVSNEWETAEIKAGDGHIEQSDIIFGSEIHYEKSAVQIPVYETNQINNDEQTWHVPITEVKSAAQDEQFNHIAFVEATVSSTSDLQADEIIAVSISAEETMSSHSPYIFNGCLASDTKTTINSIDEEATVSQRDDLVLQPHYVEADINVADELGLYATLADEIKLDAGVYKTVLDTAESPEEQFDGWNDGLIVGEEFMPDRSRKKEQIYSVAESKMVSGQKRILDITGGLKHEDASKNIIPVIAADAIEESRSLFWEHTEETIFAGTISFTGRIHTIPADLFGGENTAVQPGEALAALSEQDATGNRLFLFEADIPKTDASQNINHNIIDVIDGLEDQSAANYDVELHMIESYESPFLSEHEASITELAGIYAKLADNGAQVHSEDGYEKSNDVHESDFLSTDGNSRYATDADLIMLDAFEPAFNPLPASLSELATFAGFGEIKAVQEAAADQLTRESILLEAKINESEFATKKTESLLVTLADEGVVVRVEVDIEAERGVETAFSSGVILPSELEQDAAFWVSFTKEASLVQVDESISSATIDASSIGLDNQVSDSLIQADSLNESAFETDRIFESHLISSDALKAEPVIFVSIDKTDSLSINAVFEAALISTDHIQSATILETEAIQLTEAEWLADIPVDVINGGTGDTLDPTKRKKKIWLIPARANWYSKWFNKKTR